MSKEKQSVKKFRLSTCYSMLIIIAALFMCVGYASVIDVKANVEGELNATPQTGVFITNVEATDTENVQINYYIGNMVDSKVTLSDSEAATVSYNVTVYNSTSDINYMFVGVAKDESSELCYTNDNIKYTLTNVEEKVTILKPKESLTFIVTFEYDNKTDRTNNILESKLNYRFKEVPILELDVDGQTMELTGVYPGCEVAEYTFKVSNYKVVENETQVNRAEMSYTIVPTITEPLTAKIYKGEEEITSEISLVSDGNTQEDTYTLKIMWEPEENTTYSVEDYANKDFICNLKVTANPGEKYLGYTIEKGFDINIKSAPLYFNSIIEDTDITIKDGEANLPIQIVNYNSDTEYDNFDTEYEISILDNEKFEVSIGDTTSTNDVFLRTITAGKKDDTFDIKFTGVMDELEVIETVTLKITAKTPYTQEIIEQPINIKFHEVTLTYDATGGSVSPSEKLVYQTRTYGELPTPVWQGREFLGWFTEEDDPDTDTVEGEEILSTTIVTTDAEIQTIYAHWKSWLLADNVEVGDYVNYPVSYSNVATDKAGTYIPSDATYSGWRVLSTNTETKEVRLVTAGIPMTYVHPLYSSGTLTLTSGQKSATNITTGFFSTAINSTSTSYTFRRCGFTGVSTIAGLKSTFANVEYTQLSSSGVPLVQSMTKDDIDEVWLDYKGVETGNATYLTDLNLLAIKASDQSGMYAPYHVGTAMEGYYLWNVYIQGAIVYTDGERGIRPVVTLKPEVEITGQSGDVWQLKEME